MFIVYYAFRFQRMTFKNIINQTRKMTDVSYLGKRDFWRKRYDWSQQVKFDWLVDAEKVMLHILPSIQRINTKSSAIKLNVLDVGCGTSELPSLLLEKSPEAIKIFCVDFAVGSLKWQHELLSETKPGNILSNYWLVLADVCHLPFADNFFEIVIDKGTSDSLMKMGKENERGAPSMLKECLRVKSPEGKILQITDEDPELRLNFLELNICDIHKTRTSWKILQENPEYFMYTIES